MGFSLKSEQQPFMTKELSLGEGGCLAEWSTALQMREEKNENQNILGSTPNLGNLLKERTFTRKPVSKSLKKLITKIVNHLRFPK